MPFIKKTTGIPNVDAVTNDLYSLLNRFKATSSSGGGTGGITDHRALNYLNSANYWHLTEAEYNSTLQLSGLIEEKENIGVAAGLILEHETEWDHDSFLTTIPNHNDLSGLNVGDYQHFSTLQKTDLTDSGDTTLHYHSSDRNRANHTGTQAIGTVSGLQAALDGKQPLNSNLTTIAGLSHIIRNVIISNGTSWESRALEGSDIPILYTGHIHNLDNMLSVKESIGNKGQANGYASLDSAGKVPVTQLPNSIMEYKGNWNASTNTPTLADGTGNTGDTYRVSVAGTKFTPAISFAVGDYCIYNGSKWEKSDATDAVTSVDGRQGAVTLSDLYCSINDSRLSDARTPLTHTLTSHSDWSTYFDQVLKTTSSPSFTGLSVTTNSGSSPLYITRTGNVAESLKIYVDDATAHIYKKNDESSGTIRFTVENTDTESGGGVSANSAYWEMYSNISSSQLRLVRGSDTFVYYHTGNLVFGASAGDMCQGNDPRLSDARTPLAHNHDSVYAKLTLDFQDSMETGRAVKATGLYTYNVSSSATNKPSGLLFGSALTWGKGATGSVQIVAGWTASDQNYLAFRSLRDTTDNWYAWKRIYHEGYKPSLGDIGLTSGEGDLVVHDIEIRGKTVYNAALVHYSSIVNIDVTGISLLELTYDGGDTTYTLTGGEAGQRITIVNLTTKTHTISNTNTAIPRAVFCDMMKFGSTWCREY